MTNDDLVGALRAAAEALLGRIITAEEQNQLVRAFNAARGTTAERTTQALVHLTGLTESAIQKRSAASDNLDRVMQQLANVAKHWRPTP